MILKIMQLNILIAIPESEDSQFKNFKHIGSAYIYDNIDIKINSQIYEIIYSQLKFYVNNNSTTKNEVSLEEILNLLISLSSNSKVNSSSIESTWKNIAVTKWVDLFIFSLQNAAESVQLKILRIFKDILPFINPSYKVTLNEYSFLYKIEKSAQF